MEPPKKPNQSKPTEKDEDNSKKKNKKSDKICATKKCEMLATKDDKIGNKSTSPDMHFDEKSPPTLTEPDITPKNDSLSSGFSVITSLPFNSMGKNGNLSQEELHAKYRYAFQLFDKNNDGKISLNELMSGMKALNQDITKEEGDKILKYFDRDGTGTIDFNDFIEKVKERPEILTDKNEKLMAFKVLDRNGDGYIDKEDLRKGMSLLGVQITDPEIASMFAAGDKDKDGKLSLEEFSRVWDDCLKRKQ